jgi:hypothetical protein
MAGIHTEIQAYRTSNAERSSDPDRMPNAT